MKNLPKIQTLLKISWKSSILLIKLEKCVYCRFWQFHIYDLSFFSVCTDCSTSLPHQFPPHLDHWDHLRISWVHTLRRYDTLSGPAHTGRVDLTESPTSLLMLCTDHDSCESDSEGTTISCSDPSLPHPLLDLLPDDYFWEDLTLTFLSIAHWEWNQTEVEIPRLDVGIPTAWQ